MFSHPRAYDETAVANSISIPTCMYRMPRIYPEPTNISLSGHTNTSSATHMAMDIQGVLKRQAALLDKVKFLKEEVETFLQPKAGTKHFNAKSGSSNQQSSRSALVQDFFKGTCVKDIVVSADPSSPPLAVLVLCQQLCSRYRVLLRAHTHSSVRELPASLKDLFSSGIVSSRSEYELVITLVWKKVANGCELIVSPHNQVHVQGEAVVARFLASLLGWQPSLLESTAADMWMERAAGCTNTKQAGGLLKSVTEQFKSFPFLVSGQACVADAVVWSSLGRAGLLKTPGGVAGAWHNRLIEEAEYKNLLPLLTV